MFGNRRWIRMTTHRLLAVCTGHDGDRLLSIDLAGGAEPDLLFQDASLSQLSLTDRGCILVASTEDRPPRIVMLDAERNQIETPAMEPGPLIPDGHSHPETLQCQTESGEDVWAYYYPPYHPRIAGPQGEAPPLLVMVHGGPTARTNRAFHPLRQYFPTLGFAVLDGFLNSCKG